jgi:hypothetical protein
MELKKLDINDRTELIERSIMLSLPFKKHRLIGQKPQAKKKKTWSVLIV